MIFVSCSVIQTQVSPGEISGITGFRVYVVVSDTFWRFLKPLEVTRDNVPQSKKQYTQNSLSKLFLDLDISKGYQGGNSLNPWNSSRENCQSFKDRNDCKIVSNIKQFLSPASIEEQYLHRRWCWRCWGVSQSWEMVGLETNHSYFMMRKLCKGRTDKNTWATLAMSISFDFFFVRSRCQDVCVTHTKAGTKRRWPTCTSRCWTVVFVHLLNDDKASRSLLDSCITIINDCTWLSLHHVAKCNACSGKAIDGIIFLVQHVLVLHWVLFWELSLHAKTWLANRLFSLMAANTSLITESCNLLTTI